MTMSVTVTVCLFYLFTLKSDKIGMTKKIKTVSATVSVCDCVCGCL